DQAHLPPGLAQVVGDRLALVVLEGHLLSLLCHHDTPPTGLYRKPCGGHIKGYIKPAVFVEQCRTPAGRGPRRQASRPRWGRRRRWAAAGRWARPRVGPPCRPAAGICWREWPAVMGASGDGAPAPARGGAGGSGVAAPAAVAWPRPLVPVRLVRRVNRFAVEAVLDQAAASETGAPASTGDEPAAGAAVPGLLRLHLPNSGRMGELLVPGTPGRARLWPGQPGHSDGLGPADRPDAPDRPARRTHGELLLVRYGGRWVSVDARMPNRLFEACLAARALPAWARAVGWQREVRWGHGRIDFRVDMPAPEPPWLVEAKSCNL